ncbi:MAG: bifunctional DNA primase/polymerase [Bradyrhizobium sp.]|uniref:bifunctional DNA primase/polymerase n=1 Tax=Bradyrhizobium sp. TaxID=376 RepID=UPI0027279795|nr:bifunctional DNA primase/polymerase [Bradyrhizobium sp.]MDO8396406.1 bifunctional DNA primase/polymerase [Bradyrhizobium sp.]
MNVHNSRGGEAARIDATSGTGAARGTFPRPAVVAHGAPHPTVAGAGNDEPPMNVHTQPPLTHTTEEPPLAVPAAALFYAQLGHTVFPVPPGEKKSHKSKKHSGGQNWGQTRLPEEVRRDFSQWPNANVGLPTGSHTGFFVVEADTVQGHAVDGIASLTALQEKYGPLPPTRTARSPSGSVHYYFKLPPGVEIKNSASSIAPGVDVRGEGGMVVAPPSIKPGRGRYEWTDWRAIEEAPSWLIELCQTQKTPRKKLDGVRAENAEAPNQETILAAVAVIPNNDLGWEEWNRVAMAIYAAFNGSDAGYEAFKEWSQKSSKFDEAGTDDRWEKLRSSPPETIGVGTLLYLADLAAPGWRGATPPPEIAELNKKYALVIVGDKATVMDTSGESVGFLQLEAFNTWHANKFVTHNEKKVPLGKYWMQHPQRREYSGLVFSPNRKVPGYFNLWRGFSVEPDPNGDCSKLLAHVKDNICRGDENLYKWVIGWFADIVQHPEVKNGTSLVVRGEQGTGKTIVGKYFGSLFARHYVLASSPRKITGQFNAHLKACLLLHADEGFWAGDHEAEGVLKDLVTNDQQYIEFKGKEMIMVANYIRLFVVGNAEWVVPAGFGERRWAILEAGEAHRKDTVYFTAIKQEMDGGGRAALLYYLLNFDLTGIDLRTVPNTATLLGQQLASLNSEQGWWLDVLHRGELPWGCEATGDCPVAALFNQYIRHAQKQGVRRRSIETQLGMFLTKHVPDLRKSDRDHKVPTRNGGSRTFAFCVRPPVAELPTATAAPSSVMPGPEKSNSGSPGKPESWYP